MAFYFHGTHTEQQVQSILQSREIRVEHKQSYKGAFVSNRPEPGYGSFYFAFRKSIEFLSPPLNFFNQPTNTPGVIWSGFSEPIPVAAETLAYMAVKGYTEEQCQQLAERCKAWAGYDVVVVPMSVIEARIETMRAAGVGSAIPAGWNTR
jgi:hypothetical protein